MSNCIYKIRCLANNINSYQAKATDEEEEEKEEEEIFIDLEDEDLEEVKDKKMQNNNFVEENREE